MVTGQESVSGHSQTTRLLFCGVQNDEDLRKFKDALGEVDFVSVHSTEPDEVLPYWRHFMPHYTILGSQDEESIKAALEVLRDVAGKEDDCAVLAATITEQLKLDRTLSERQAEIVRYLANGCSNKQIAEFMEVQPRTVKEWLTELFRIFYVGNRTELVGRLNEINWAESAALLKIDVHKNEKLELVQRPDSDDCDLEADGTRGRKK
ncbi:LuxR C-terminal-related transcriptional regulator [Granulicella sp. L60]|uniref:LuxR family transcriptional regulator n=1 Tax=Granulicella sp. L60 TaxID=1641866 RepID=UPI00131BE33D|nr:LuxR C-terminal-related transcriptional regulator [Granulicella sp. L60]